MGNLAVVLSLDQRAHAHGHLAGVVFVVRPVLSLQTPLQADRHYVLFTLLGGGVVLASSASVFVSKVDEVVDLHFLRRARPFTRVVFVDEAAKQGLRKLDVVH